MFLVRLIYASTVCDNLTQNDIEELLSISKKNNASVGVTGLLLFSQDYFLQCLEGSRSQVNAIYQHILNDRRHKKVILLEYTEVAEREFGEWSMGYVPNIELTSPVNLRYSSSKHFDPYNMSGESAPKLLVHLRKVVNIA
ncbi:BLUF domain-containing protein [Vibrio sp. 16]|uniref:BLUF domain-containing protein n=1 Tax=Vibrio sp. 16 TaxID=391586 RepID=UPI002FF3C9C3